MLLSNGLRSVFHYMTIEILDVNSYYLSLKNLARENQ
jgi:hypothetical protein